MIVVTTPTGSIGHQVVEGLLAQDATVRVVVRDPARLAPDVRDRVEIVAGSHGDAAVVERAFDGADAVFWLAPPPFAEADLDAAYAGFARPAAEAFARQGVHRVVGVSALGRDTPLAAHAGLVTASLRMDDLIAGTGVGYRALTMSSFMDNLRRQVRRIATDGLVTGPLAADRKLPYVATRDVAAAAVRLLADDSWTGSGEVPVPGPEDLSYDDMTRVLSEVLGRPVRYRRITPEAFRDGLLSNGASPAVAQGTLDMMLAKDAGLDDGVARTPATAAGTTFRAWCAEVLAPLVTG